jgi:opacity protein-like surface antigen
MRTGMRVAVCGLLLLSASAVPAADRGFYFGASAGQAQYDFDQPAVPAPVLGFLPPIVEFGPTLPVLPPPPVFVGGVVTTAVLAQPVLWLPEDDDEGTTWSVTAGYRINRYLAVEAGYVDLGTLSATHSINFPPVFGIPPLNFHRELETAGPSLTVFGTLPLSANWQLYARAGMLFADTDLKTSISGTSTTSSFDSDATTLGAGAQYDWGGHWSARLEFQRTMDVGGDDVASAADVDNISLGFLYRL